MSISKEEIWRRVGQVTSGYPLLECDKCAVAVIAHLKSWGIAGTVLRLRTKSRRNRFVISERHGCDDESITRNGTHYGVEVLGKVFDNLSSEGLSREDWQADFSCIGGRFTLEEVSISLLEDETL